MTNAEIAQIFSKIAEILAIQNENRFRIRAYEKAAVTVESLPHELKERYEKKGPEALKGIPGIGEDLSAKIEELLKTGTLKFFEDLKKKVPQGLLQIMDIEGMGPKKTKFVWEKFRVRSVEELEALCKSGKLTKLKGWGEKSVANTLRGIELRRKFGERMPLGKAYPLAERIVARLRESGLAQKVEIAGSLRRMRETVGDIDVLATSTKSAKLIELFTKMPEVSEVESRGPTKCTVMLKNGMDCDLRVLDPQVFGAALHYFTGSKAHNVHFRTIAVKKGLTVSEYGVFRGTKEHKGKLVACHTEEDVFKTIGLPWIPPEIREDTGEIEAAQRSVLPKLIEQKDIRGDLHSCHSNFSDGTASIEEMLAAAKRAGLEYVAVTDHASVMGMVKGIKLKSQIPNPNDQSNPKSKKSKILNLKSKISNIAEYIKLVKAAAKKVKGIHALIGAEVDILANGSLYLPDALLKQLDWVVASIHSNFRQSADVATKRLIKAMENPFVRVIGHPTTRLIGERSAVEFNWDEVYAAAKRTATFLELNAHWSRLDLSDVHCRAAKQAGVKICINTDAHNLLEFDFRFGVATARRGWLEPRDVVNALPWKEFEKIVGKK